MHSDPWEQMTDPVNWRPEPLRLDGVAPHCGIRMLQGAAPGAPSWPDALKCIMGSWSAEMPQCCR
jgi:hypothetical protein